MLAEQPVKSGVTFIWWVTISLPKAHADDYNPFFYYNLEAARKHPTPF